MAKANDILKSYTIENSEKSVDSNEMHKHLQILFILLIRFSDFQGIANF